MTATPGADDRPGLGAAPAGRPGGPAVGVLEESAPAEAPAIPTGADQDAASAASTAALPSPDGQGLTGAPVTRADAADPVAPADGPSVRVRPTRRTVALHLAVVAGYLAVAVVLWWRVWVTGHPTTAMTCPCGDPSEELWWLQWLPWAVLHGHNPLFTHAMNAGAGGANALTNTSWFLPAAVAAPITLLFGPVASFNVLATLTPVVSAWCMFLLCRRLVAFVPGQVLAGLLWGFSPWVVTNLPFGHLHMVTGFFPPLAALVCVNLVEGRARGGTTEGARAERPAWLLGLALAGLVVAQFFVSTEYLVDSLLMGAVASVVAVAVAWGHLWRRRRRIGVGVGVAVAVSGVVLAYPTWYAQAGPGSVTGKVWPNNGVGIPGSGLVDPGPVVHTPTVYDAGIGYFGPHGPSGLYLGVPLLAFLAVSAVCWYRRRLAWVVVVSGVAAWVFALGEGDGGSVWAVVARLPLLEKIQPDRFADFVMFSAALLLAVSLDGWRRVAQGARTGPPWVVAAVLATVGVVVLAPVADTYSIYVEHPEPTPAWYTADAPALSAGTTVFTVPLPDYLPTNAMVWQAEDDFRFDLVGGYVVSPGPDGHTDTWRSPLTGTNLLVQQLSFAAVSVPSSPNDQTAQVRDQLRRWGVGVVVVSAPAKQPTFAAAYLTAVLGRPPVYRGGAWVWYGLGTAPARPLTGPVLTACAAVAAHSADPLAGPGCVLARTPGLTGPS